MNRKALGRGLGALLPPQAEGEMVAEIHPDQIDPNPLQPRKTFDPGALDELAASIRAAGVIQPVVVRKVGARYQLIAGERRWRAARQAGLDRIPAVVRQATDAEALELALVENLLREDLNPMEEAEGYQRLLAEFGWTQDELAGKIGRDRSTIANSLRLLRLPATIQEDLRSGRLTMGHARALLALTAEADQLKLRGEILAQSWSVRRTEEGVRTHRAAHPRPRRRSAELAALEGALQKALMTRVRIVGNDRGGKIEIIYATPDELERLGELLGVRS
jgi:ParB family chromosome partitioning protein